MTEYLTSTFIIQYSIFDIKNLFTPARPSCRRDSGGGFYSVLGRKIACPHVAPKPNGLAAIHGAGILGSRIFIYHHFGCRCQIAFGDSALLL
jgi:hypothetical protein